MGFGELNDKHDLRTNALFEISWAGTYLYIIYALTHVKKESNKREAYCWESSIVWRKARDKYSWNIIKWSLFMAWHIWNTNYESIIARLHGLIKIKRDIHLWARYIGLIYGILQCMKYGYHSQSQRKTKKWRYENGIWNSLLVCKA